MSNTNGQISFVKSMNGILSFNTGSGIIIEGDSITADNINCTTLTTTNFDTDNIQGITPTDAITLYTDTTNDISLGNSLGLGTLVLTNKLVDIGSSGNTIDIILNSHTTTLSGSITNLNSTETTITGTITNLNSTSTKVVNPLYVNQIFANIITTGSGLFTTSTTGSIGIGNSLTTGAMFIGGVTGTGNITLRTKGAVALVSGASSINLGNNCPSISIGAIASNGIITIGHITGLGSTVDISGSAVNLDALTLNLGNSASTINVGNGTTNTTINGNTTNLHSDITDIAGTTANLNSITTTIDGTDANLFSTNTTISGTTANLNSNTITLAGTTTDLNSTTTTITGTTTNLSSPNINLGSGISGDINTYGANFNVNTTNTFINSTGIIIGAVGSSTTIFGTLSIPGTLVMDNIQATSPIVAVSLYGNTTTGNLNIGAGMTTGGIILGNNAQTGYIYVNASTYLTNGSNFNVSGAGSYIYSENYIRSPVISPPTIATNCNIYSTLTTGNLSIGTGMTTGGIILGDNAQTGELTLRTGGILALGNFSPTINIGTNQLLSTDIINIGNITGGLAGINLGAKTINIGNISTSIQIGNYMVAGGAGINIGNSAITTAIDGSTLNVGRYATAVNMGTSMTTGNNINIGNSVVTTNLNGQTINMGYGMVAGSNINIGNSVVTTNLSGQTINIGNGTAINLGPANITSSIVSKCPHTFNNGISFLNSNVLRDKIIRGRDTTTLGIPAGGTVSQTHFYTGSYTFGANPDVVATINGGSAVILMSITTIQTDRFITISRNTSVVPLAANSYAISFIAMGSI